MDYNWSSVNRIKKVLDIKNNTNRHGTLSSNNNGRILIPAQVIHQHNQQYIKQQKQYIRH